MAPVSILCPAEASQVFATTSAQAEPSTIGSSPLLIEHLDRRVVGLPPTSESQFALAEYCVPLGGRLLE